MKTIFVVTTILLIWGAGNSFGSIEAGPITNNANGHVYYLLTPNSWTNSEAEALSLGGHLVSITNQAEQDWVFLTFSSIGASNKYLWIGLTDAGHEGTWTWTSGEPITFTSWSTGEPNNSGNVEHFAHMFTNGKWNDHSAWPNYTVDLIPFQGVVEISVTRAPTEPIAVQVFTAIEVEWLEQPNKRYQVQSAPQLSSNSWQNVGAPLFGAGRTNRFYDRVTNGQQRFFRVLASPD